MSRATKDTDESIVAGFGLAGYCDDSAMEEPSAASTAGHKTSRKDLINKQSTDYLNQLMPPPSSFPVKHSRQTNGCHNDVRQTEVPDKFAPNGFIPHATIDAQHTLDKMMPCGDVGDFSAGTNREPLRQAFTDFIISPQKSLEQRLAEAKQGSSNHSTNERNIPHIRVDADRSSPELLSSSAFKSSEGNDSSWLLSSIQKQSHAPPTSIHSLHPSSTPSRPTDEDNHQSGNFAMNFSEISSQGDLQHLMDMEQFGEANFYEMEADEKRLEESKLVGLPVHSGEMTGICAEDEAEITVSKSWLGPKFCGREKVSSDGSRVKVKVGDYLKSGSMALGSLGGSGASRPSFGFGQKLMSPPSANSTHFSTASSPENLVSVSDSPFDKPTPGNASDSPFKMKRNSLGLFGSSDQEAVVEIAPSSATAPSLETAMPSRTRGDGLSLEPSRPSSTATPNYGSLGRSKHMKSKPRVVEDTLNLEAKMTAVEEIKSLLSKVSSDDSPRTKITQLQDLLCGLNPYDRSELQEETMINQSLEINALKKRRQEIMYGQDPSALMKNKLVTTKSAPSRVDYSQNNLIEEEYEECNIEEATLDDTIRMTPNVSCSQVLKDETKTDNPFLSLCDMTQAMDITDTTHQGTENHHLLVEGCVQSIATWFSIPIDNPTENYIRVSARINSETLNGGPVQNSSLIFKEGYVIPPNEKVVWVAGVCGRELGTLLCVLSLSLVDMSSGEELVAHTIPVKATINLPQVRIGEKGDLKEDVGLIPEISRHDSQLEIINDSDRELAVLISFTQHGNFFQFRESENIRFVSSSEVACVLKPGMNPLLYSIQPPQLEVDAKSLNISSTVSVKIDSPQLPRPCLATKDVSATIVPIIVNIPRSCFPLNLPLSANKLTSVQFSLANLSCIPISVAVTIKDSTAKNLDLQVVPNNLHLEANSVANPIVYCQPLEVNTTEPFNAVVIITLNTKGLEYTIPLIGKPMETPSPKERISQSILNLKVPVPKKDYVHIQATRSTLLFSAVQTNTTVSQRISFSNTNAYDVTLCPSISEEFSSVFTADCQTLTIPARSSASITVSFSPQGNKDYSTVMVCRTQGLHRQFKYSIALQGYGGCGVLNMEDKMLLFPKSSPGVPSIVRLPLNNTGSRAISVVVSHTGSQESLTIPCRELVIPAGEERKIVLMWCSNQNIGARDGQVHLGDLVVRYSEELLRRRYTRRLEEGCPKAASFSRGGGSSWTGFFSGEEQTKERNDLKSHSDDSKVFFNSLRKLQMPMYCTLTDSTSDASTTCFSPLLPDMTVADSTHYLNAEFDGPVPPRESSVPPKHFVFPSAEGSGQERVNRTASGDDKENVRPRTPLCVKNESLLEVLPQEVTLVAGGLAGIVAVNRDEHTQSFTIKCDESLLKANPVSGTIAPSGSLGILLEHTGKGVSSPLVLKLVCGHHETVVRVNVAAGAEENKPTNGINTKTAQPVSDVVTREPTQKPAEVGVSVGGLSVAHYSLSFPMTYVHKESCMKLSIRNPTPYVKQVLASISTGSSFVVKHPHFKIKAGYFVNIPLYFKPRCKGDQKATLKLSVGDSDCTVQLTGSAVV